MSSTATLLKHPLASGTWDAAERDAIIQVLESDRLSMGRKVEAFEAEFARYIGTKYAVMVNSGSSANLLMVAAYTLRYGKGTVIVPAVSWATSYSPFQQYGWRLVFVDVDDSFNIDPHEVLEAQKRYRGAIVLGVHLLGNPCQFYAFDARFDVLEDNCESLGAEYGDKKTGSLGVMGSHSFYFSHHICTMEGGAITTNDRTFYEMLLSLRSHGWTRHLPENNVLGAKVAPFEFIYPGYNVRPMEIQAAIGLTQLEKLPEILRIRRDNARRFPLQTPREVGTSSWFAFATPKTPALEEKCETRPVVAGNFTRSPSLKYYDHVIQGSLPMANQIHDHWCYLGNSPKPIDWSFLA
jgi:CDP-6-deoxy-D-xylo-4-hexulose-3-dehydrase